MYGVDRDLFREVYKVHPSPGRLRAIVAAWSEDDPPPVRQQMAIISAIRRARREVDRKTLETADWLRGATRSLCPPIRGRPARYEVHRSRYERRIKGLTLEEIAKQDGVTSGAIWQSVRGYARRIGMPMPAYDRSTVSASELAKIIGVREETVSEWRSTGRIPFVQSGKRYQFSLDDVRVALFTAGWGPGRKLWNPSSVIGRSVLARREEAGTGKRLCMGCRELLPIDRFPPSGGQCKTCRRPAKRANDARRRMAKSTTQVEQIDIRVVAARDGNRCGICRRSVARKQWSMDHVVPLSKGGPHTYANVVLAHLSCNSRRGAGRIAVQAALFATLPEAP